MSINTLTKYLFYLIIIFNSIQNVPNAAAAGTEDPGRFTTIEFRPWLFRFNRAISSACSRHIFITLMFYEIFLGFVRSICYVYKYELLHSKKKSRWLTHLIEVFASDSFRKYCHGRPANVPHRICIVNWTWTWPQSHPCTSSDPHRAEHFPFRFQYWLQVLTKENNNNSIIQSCARVNLLFSYRAINSLIFLLSRNICSSLSILNRTMYIYYI